MKVQEFQIGDLVDYRGKVIKVTSLYAKGGSNEVGFSDREDIWVNGRVLKPIPLTPEILLNNGFENDFYEDEVVADNGISVRHEGYSFNGNGILVTFCKNFIQVVNDYTDADIKLYCTCVHHLQQALRIAGIEKKITI